MSERGTETDTTSIGELFTQLADDASSLLRAELELYREKAISQVAKARNAVLLLIGALFFAQAAVTAALVGLGIILVRWLGPIAGGLCSAAIGIAIALILAAIGVRMFKAAFPIGENE